MGCRQQGREKKSAENEKIEKFEDAFGFRLYECSFFEGILSRLTAITSSQQFLEYFQKFTKLSFLDSLKQHLTNTYSDNEKIQLKGFRVWCILMSKSSEQDKAESLWYVFDDTLQDSLLNTQIKEMISSLLTAAVSVSVPLALKSADDEKLRTWEGYLRDRVESLETKLIKHFTQGKESVNKEEFLLRINDRPEGLITSATGIRAQLEHTQVIPNKFANPFKKMKVTKLTG